MKMTAMRLAVTVLGLTVGGALPLAIALADDQPPPATCVKVIPARSEWVVRDVVRPAVMAERSVPVLETVQVPIFETRCVPEFREVEDPVYATREVQDFTERRVPEYGPVEVPVTEQRVEPVTLKLPNPFACDDLCLHLWDRCETVVCGTRTETGIVGWRTERVPFTRTETYVSGTRKRQVQVGERTETVKVGERGETRQTGWRKETYEAVPAETEQVRECVALPAESVTVVTSGNPAAAQPLPGTTRVMTEDDYRREIAAAPMP